MNPLEHSLVPYTIRSFYEWIADGGGTPHITVNARWPGVLLPAFLYPKVDAQPGVVLNLDMRAISNMVLGNEYITFGARFNKIHHDITIPIAAVMHVFCKETQQGATFHEAFNAPPLMEKPQAISSATPSSGAGAKDQAVYDSIADNYHDGDKTPPTERKRGHLSVVK